MSDQLELDANLENVALELDAPAATSPTALLAKPGTLTGSLVQRGRERAPRLMESSQPMELAPRSAQAMLAHPPHGLAAERPAAPAIAERSRWTDVIFAAACCVAFFATFLFVLRF